MRVRILRERRLVPPGLRRISVHYLPGMEVTVKRAWGDVLVASGDAVEIDPPPRNFSPPEMRA
jgi:hypothetical protein